MTGLFTCPHCGAQTEVSDAFAGMSGPCARCGRTIVVPPLGGTSGASGQFFVGQPARGCGARGLVILGALVVLLIVGFVVVARGLAAMFREMMEREQCEQQMSKIRVAIGNYYDEYSVYPPAVVTDKNGKPLHSWRVLVLPYLGQDEEKLYKQYHFDEPWDGPNNRDLAWQMPLVYACPCDTGVIDGHTSYLALVDAATGDLAGPLPNFGNGPPPLRPAYPTRYVLVEVSDSGVPWLEPRDILVGSPPGGGANRPGIPAAEIAQRARLSNHVGGSHALGSTTRVETLPPETLGEAVAPASSEAEAVE